jgi:hypothetical protein
MSVDLSVPLNLDLRDILLQRLAYASIVALVAFAKQILYSMRLSRTRWLAIYVVGLFVSHQRTILSEQY